MSSHALNVLAGRHIGGGPHTLTQDRGPQQTGQAHLVLLPEDLHGLVQLHKVPLLGLNL